MNKLILVAALTLIAAPAFAQGTQALQNGVSTANYTGSANGGVWKTTDGGQSAAPSGTTARQTTMTIGLAAPPEQPATPFPGFVGEVAAPVPTPAAVQNERLTLNGSGNSTAGDVNHDGTVDSRDYVPTAAAGTQVRSGAQLQLQNH